MPAVELWLNDVPQFFDANGDPLAGGQLFFYAAGSSTKINTYTTAAGTIPNSNPMILDAAGRPQQAIWLIAGQLYKIGLADSTEPDPPNNFIPSWPIDNVSGINDSSTAVTEWIASGFTPTYISANSFSVPGDQTSVLPVQRRLQIVDAGGTKYATIVTSAFTTLTTVTVVVDGGSLSNPISSVAYGINDPVHPSISPDLVNRKSASVASAATTNVWATNGNYVHVTGNTGPITSLGTAPYDGNRRLVIFDSNPQVTTGANLQVKGYGVGVTFTVTAGAMWLVTADTTTSFSAVAINPNGESPVVAAFQKAIAGLIPSNNVADANNDIDISAGSCRDSTNIDTLTLSASITKRLDANWVVGTNQGGLDTGGEASSTWYHVFVIKRPDTGVVDALFSLSATAPTLPANYTLFRRVGSVFNDGSSNLTAFISTEASGGGVEFLWSAPTLDINLTDTLTTSRRVDVIKVPTGISVMSCANYNINDNDAANYVVWIYSPLQSDQAPSASVAPLGDLSQTVNNGNFMAQLKIQTNTSAQIAARSDGANVDAYRASTIGWLDWRR